MLTPTGIPIACTETPPGAFNQPRSSEPLDVGKRTAHVIFGEQSLRKFASEISQLRVRCGQQDDFTTDPQYFTAINMVKGKRVGGTLIRHCGQLEACVLFFEYSKFGINLGVFRAGAKAGESLAIAPEESRMQYVALATRALLAHWRASGVRLTAGAAVGECVAMMGPENQHRVFFPQNFAHKLPLESSYQAMLASMGSRTRRSLATKRRQLEGRAGVVFVPALEPAAALEAMLSLQSRSIPFRMARFYHARYALAGAHPAFFCMGICSPDGTWLSLLSGWRQNKVTYVDLQMNDAGLRKESLSAVMRAFMLEHEIGAKQELVDFVDGTSVLLRRYCQPAEPCTCAYLCRPGLRAKLFHAVMGRIEAQEFSTMVKPGNGKARAHDAQNADMPDFSEGGNWQANSH